MTINTSKDTLILSVGPAAGALGDRIGELDLHVAESATSVPFVMLDCFDQSIRNTNRMLIESARKLVLFHDGGSVMQDARRSGNFVADLAEGPVKDALNDVSPLRSLLNFGSGAITRRSVSLTDDEGKTCARADLTNIYPKNGEVTATLASVKGLRGFDEALEALRTYLKAFVMPGAGHIVDLPDLLFPGRDPYVAKPEIAIADDESAFQAANDIIASYISVARRNEAGMIADHDTEFLHDYRVALRKIRSVISLFRGVYSADQTAALKRSFSELMAPTGRLRDLDVYLLERDHYFGMLPDTLHGGLSLMFRQFEQERRREHKRLAKYLDSPAYLKAITEMQTLFADGAAPERGPEGDQRALDYACTQIWKRYRKGCKTAAVIDAGTSNGDIHRLRINCKKLRYLMEFFAPIFPERQFKSALKPLKDLQDSLGRFNDYSVQQVSLLNFMENHRSLGQKQDLQLAQSIGALIAVLHGRMAAERGLVVSGFAQFDSAVVRANFRDLFVGKVI